MILPVASWFSGHSENTKPGKFTSVCQYIADCEYSAKFAREHLEIIRRFGRFPHRNKALGRPSTAREIAFLDEHSYFGQ